PPDRQQAGDRIVDLTTCAALSLRRRRLLRLGRAGGQQLRHRGRDLAPEQLSVVQLPQPVLQLSELVDDRLDVGARLGERVQQVSETLGGDACYVRLGAVADVRDGLE